MKIVARTGSAIEAARLQNANNVSEPLRGSWYHGTGNKAFREFTNKGPKVTCLTRSPAGGIKWGPKVLQVYIVSPLDFVAITDAGAGDDGGTDPNDSRRKLHNWWLTVKANEIDKLRVVDSVDKRSMSSDELNRSLSDLFYRELVKKMVPLSQGDDS